MNYGLIAPMGVFLLIEFLDELAFGVVEAAKPLFRTDLSLTYTQIGLLFFVPGLVSSMVEPVLGILGDVWRRRLLILAGGIFFGLSFALTALSRNFAWLLLAMVISFPASGAFVSLSQASLMDTDPARHNHNMARWTVAGSVGVVAGPLLLSATLSLDQSWRSVFWLIAVLAILLVTLAFRSPYLDSAKQNQIREDELPAAFWAGIQGALQSLKRGEVVRWLVLLQFSDLMLDILLGFLALYFVDVAGLSPSRAALAVAVWTGVGLLGDFLLIPLLERVDGLAYLRVSVMLELLLFPAFLLFPKIWLKLVLVGLLGFFNAGWYAVLQGQLYSSMPGQSGTVITLNNLAGLPTGLFPLGIAAFADAFGLGSAMWLMLAGPLALLVGLPRRQVTV
jgi:FSR family fosmidomycin resistance protein-like MFS transporter